MASQRTLGVAAVLVLVAVMGCIALMGFEYELLTDRVKYLRQRVSTAAAFQVARELPSANNSNGSEAADKSVPVVQTESATEMPRQDEPDELMTPELIQRIETQHIDPLAPVQVHLVWIGEANKMPWEGNTYAREGYNLTVHTSAEEILEGFNPFVLKAYKLAIPQVVGYDFLKFALLYKYGGFVADADTKPVLHASTIKFPSDCDVMFGKESVATNWEKPVFRPSGSATYLLNRPFQILNWVMVANKPRNKHVKWLMRTAMMHFFGLRDMNYDLVQDIAGSGLMTDYVAMLHEKEGRDYREVYLDRTKYVPVEGLCLTDGYLRGDWIYHAFMGTWKPDR